MPNMMSLSFKLQNRLREGQILDDPNPHTMSINSKTKLKTVLHVKLQNLPQFYKHRHSKYLKKTFISETLNLLSQY